jgi:hypothetical protein
VKNLFIFFTDFYFLHRFYFVHDFFSLFFSVKKAFQKTNKFIFKIPTFFHFLENKRVDRSHFVDTCSLSLSLSLSLFLSLACERMSLLLLPIQQRVLLILSSQALLVLRVGAAKIA